MRMLSDLQVTASLSPAVLIVHGTAGVHDQLLTVRPASALYLHAKPNPCFLVVTLFIMNCLWNFLAVQFFLTSLLSFLCLVRY